jgi:hypothetical protein
MRLLLLSMTVMHLTPLSEPNKAHGVPSHLLYYYTQRSMSATPVRLQCSAFHVHDVLRHEWDRMLCTCQGVPFKAERQWSAGLCLNCYDTV